MSFAPSPPVPRFGRDNQKLSQLACIHAFWPFFALFLIGWVVVAGFVPPPSPHKPINELADWYRDHQHRILAGMVISGFSMFFLAAWGAGVASQIRRLDGRNGVLLWGWVLSMGALVAYFMFSVIFWSVAAYRPENLQQLQGFHDAGWFSFLVDVPSVTFQAFLIGYLVLKDNRPEPIFPRWYGYMQFLDGVAISGAALCYYFKSGPFAWNGLVGFWFTVVFGFSWMLITTVMTARAIKRAPDEPPVDDSGSLERRVAMLEQELGRLREPTAVA